MADDEKNEYTTELKDNAIATVSYETARRYGRAAKEYIVAYSGIDNETGEQRVKCLKGISRFKPDKSNKYADTHRRAGYAAEVIEVANINAANIILDNPERLVRTDDIGSVNDQIFDLVFVDKKGNRIDTNGIQMKFLGASASDPKDINAPHRALKMLEANRFDKYFENDAVILVQSDFYDKMITDTEAELDRLSDELKKAKLANDTELVKQIDRRMKRTRETKEALAPASLSSKEALAAVEHSGLLTAGKISQTAHKAGIQTAKYAAFTTGSISIIDNLAALSIGDMDPVEAVINVVSDTGNSIIFSYERTVTETVAEAAMLNAKSKTVRNIADSDIGGAMMSVLVTAADSFGRYYNGEIDGAECFNELTENGIETMSSALAAQTAVKTISSSGFGRLLGNFLGYIAASASYRIVLNAVREEKEASSRMHKVFEQVEKHVGMIRKYRAELEKNINEYLISSMETIGDALTEIEKGLRSGDADDVIAGANAITEAFGGEPQFHNMEEYRKFKVSDEPLKL